jgi:hypothetical protein
LTIKCLDLMRSAVPCLEKHVVHIIFNYNPYSIVNELLIAKISVEGNPLLHSPLMLAATLVFLRGTCTTRCGRLDFASTAAPGGADRDRTDDPLLAKQVLSQLSYSPGPKVRGQKAEGRSQTR